MKEIYNEMQNITNSVFNIANIIEENDRATDTKLSELETINIRRLAEIFEDLAKKLRKIDKI